MIQLKTFALLTTLSLLVACQSSDKKPEATTKTQSEKPNTASQTVGQNQAAANAQSAGAITTVSETVRSQEVSKQKKIERLLRKIHENCKIDGLGERVPIRLTNNMDGALVNYEVMLNADKINIACFDKHAVECQSDFKQLREKYKNDKSMENKYRTYTLFLNK